MGRSLGTGVVRGEMANGQLGPAGIGTVATPIEDALGARSESAGSSHCGGTAAAKRGQSGHNYDFQNCWQL